MRVNSKRISLEAKLNTAKSKAFKLQPTITTNTPNDSVSISKDLSTRTKSEVNEISRSKGYKSLARVALVAASIISGGIIGAAIGATHPVLGALITTLLPFAGIVGGVLSL